MFGIGFFLIFSRYQKIVTIKFFVYVSKIDKYKKKHTNGRELTTFFRFLDFIIISHQLYQIHHLPNSNIISELKSKFKNIFNTCFEFLKINKIYSIFFSRKLKTWKQVILVNKEYFFNIFYNLIIDET